jgi:hypothetical protein
VLHVFQTGLGLDSGVYIIYVSGMYIDVVVTVRLRFGAGVGLPMGQALPVVHL